MQRPQPDECSNEQMVKVDAGTGALVLYNSEGILKDTSISGTAGGSSWKHIAKKDNSLPALKRQYFEVDESITLREQNRTLIATNEALTHQQMMLTE